MVRRLEIKLKDDRFWEKISLRGFRVLWVDRGRTAITLTKVKFLVHNEPPGRNIYKTT